MGLNGYTDEEKRQLDEEDRRSIIYQQNKFWSIVNVLRQLRMTSFLNTVFRAAFPKAPQTDTLDILLRPLADNNWVMDRTLKEMNVPQEMIIRECMKAQLLPSNFLI